MSCLTKQHARDYPTLAAVNPAVGIGLPDFQGAQTALSGFFVHNVHARAVYGGLGGAPFGVAGPLEPVGQPCSVRHLMIGLWGDGLLTITPRYTAMQNALILSPVSLQIVNGHPVTTSLDVARHFGKRHERVLNAIRNLECSSEFTEHNFVSSEYQDSTGRSLTMYQITRDGFVFLCMGFTGKEAAKWKEAYIRAFNEMEKELHQLPDREQLLKELIEERLGMVKVMVSFDLEAKPNVTLVKPGSLVFSAAELPDLIAKGGAHVPTALLPKIIEAAAKRLMRD